MIYRSSQKIGQLHQCEIVSNVLQITLSVDSIGSTGSPLIDPIRHAYAAVLSQSCDLETDYLLRTNARPSGSAIPSVLFCELHEAGESQAHVDDRTWRRIIINKDERYQFLRAISCEDDVAGSGIPELTIDFKNYFTIPTAEVYKRIEIGEIQRRACLESPYREHLAARFFYYQFRVALPQEHFVKQASA